MPLIHFNDKTGDDLVHTNFVGGMLAGRYIADQMPFFGFNRVMSAGDHLINASIALRCRALDRFYLSALAGAISSEDSILNLLRNPLPEAWALGAEAGYDTFAGPIKFNVHWSDAQGWGAYFSIGYDF